MERPNEIRQHISAIEQTRKITGAMELISSNRMRQVMNHIEHNRRYFTYIRRTMKELLTSSQNVSHPFLLKRPRHHVTFLVISGDKSLCGAHHSSVLNFALDHFYEQRELSAKEEQDSQNSGFHDESRLNRDINYDLGPSLITVGHTAEAFFLERAITPDVCLLGIAQDPTLTRAREVARMLISLYEEEVTDEIRVVFTSFYGETRSKPVEFRLLPVRLHDYEDIRDAEALDEIMYHPSAQLVLDMMVPQYVIGLIFDVMVQAYASEHFARMTAMHSATTNAQDMIDDLRTKYNMARQNAITNEIAEIASGAEAIRGELNEYYQQ